MTTSLPQNIARRIRIEDNGCWTWLGTLQNNGYASISYMGRSHVGHRLTYTLLVGQIPKGLEVDHLCRVRECVNPEHFEIVTHAENMRRIRRPNCANGHALVEENIYVYRGKRLCRACRRERQRQARRSAA